MRFGPKSRRSCRSVRVPWWILGLAKAEVWGFFVFFFGWLPAHFSLSGRFGLCFFEFVWSLNKVLIGMKKTVLFIVLAEELIVVWWFGLLGQLNPYRQ